MANEVTGRILHVDLTTGSIEVEDQSEAFVRTYFGGSAMGVYYILRDVPKGTGGLDPANVLTLMLSPLTGTPIAGQSRMTISARSPLVGRHRRQPGRRLLPGRAAVRRLHGDRGQGPGGGARVPVDPGRPGRAPARRPPVGQDDRADDRRAREELGDAKVEVAAIGPAGEKLARLAAIMNMANRANGRTGMGAVMGSKNLKAIAVRGTPARCRWRTARRWASSRSGPPTRSRTTATSSTCGSTAPQGVLEGQHAAGGLPTFNYNAGQFESVRGDRRRDDDRRRSSRTARPATPAPSAASGRSRPSGRAGPSTSATAARSTRRRPRSAPTAASATCTPSPSPTRSATSTASTPSAPAPRSPWPWTASTDGILSEAEIGFPAPFGDAKAMIRLLEMIVGPGGLRRRPRERLAQGRRTCWARGTTS